MGGQGSGQHVIDAGLGGELEFPESAPPIGVRGWQSFLPLAVHDQVRQRVETVVGVEGGFQQVKQPPPFLRGGVRIHEEELVAAGGNHKPGGVGLVIELDEGVFHAGGVGEPGGFVVGGAADGHHIRP